jgi:hypothetical protein
MGATISYLWHPQERNLQHVKISESHKMPRLATTVIPHQSNDMLWSQVSRTQGKETNKQTNQSNQLRAPSSTPVFNIVFVIASADFCLLLANFGPYFNPLYPHVTGSADTESVRTRLFVGLRFHHSACTPTVDV